MDTFSGVFAATSVIEDVGLFDCETDVKCTGGVYGEGTDVKVRDAVITRTESGAEAHPAA